MFSYPLWLLSIALLVINSALAFMSGYLLLLTAAAYRANRGRSAQIASQYRHFFILIPAHDEDSLLPELLESVAQLDYPSDHYAVHVVADNCTDDTAAVARLHGATVHERFDTEYVGKGYALNWLIERLKADKSELSAWLILDADSIIAPDFLQVMNAHLERGDSVIQAYYSVKNPESSFSIALRYAALTVLHYLRPLGRTYLRGSAGLKGNGMVFSNGALDEHQWSGDLTEDIRLHMDLILAGQRVTFAPAAVVWAEMPSSLANSESQNARWETGRLEMAKQYVPRLLVGAVRAAGQGNWSGAYLLFDAAMEHMIPPLSLMFGAAATSLFLSVMSLAAIVVMSGAGRIGQGESIYLVGIINAILSAVISAALGLYVWAGLYLDRAPRSVYRSLLHAPVYILWKIQQVVGIALGRREQAWIRTARNAVEREESAPT